jgi:hypothetical protein
VVRREVGGLALQDGLVGPLRGGRRPACVQFADQVEITALTAVGLAVLEIAVVVNDEDVGPVRRLIPQAGVVEPV